MNLLCPHCQKMVTVPDEYAGQLMKCPLCANTFPAPALAVPPGAGPVAASAPPASPRAGGSGPAAAPRGENTFRFASAREAQPGPPPQEPAREFPAAAAPAPAGYQRTATIWISPRVAPWIAPVAMVVVLVLSFFPWLNVFIRPASDDAKSTVQGTSAWSLAFGDKMNGLTLLYLLLMLAAVVLAMAVVILPRASLRLPPVVQQFMLWRSEIVGGVALLAFVVLVIQLLIGFNQETNKDNVLPIYGYRTLWLRLAVLAQFLAVLGAGLELWLAVRKSRPLPRIDVSW
jgi:hypothetical protein